MSDGPERDDAVCSTWAADHVDAVGAGGVTPHGFLLTAVGLGMVLFEESLLDTRDGRFVDASLAEYQVAVNVDLGSSEVLFVEGPGPADRSARRQRHRRDQHRGGCRFGRHRAIYDATGKRFRGLPITLDEVMTT